jgi:putative redox protein
MSIVAHTTVESARGYANTVHAGKHVFTADEPERLGGTDTGASPYGLLLASLGACTSITLRMYAERKQWELGTIKVALRHRKDDAGADLIERDLTFSAPLTAEQRARLAEIVEKTPVTKTIKAGAPIQTRFLDGTEPPAAG